MAEPTHYWCLIPHEHDVNPWNKKPKNYYWPIYLDELCVFFPLEIQVTQEAVVEFFRSRTKWRFHLLTELYTVTKGFRPQGYHYPGGVPEHVMNHSKIKHPGVLGIFTSPEDALRCKLAWNPRDVS